MRSLTVEELKALTKDFEAHVAGVVDDFVRWGTSFYMCDIVQRCNPGRYEKVETSVRRTASRILGARVAAGDLETSQVAVKGGRRLYYRATHKFLCECDGVAPGHALDCPVLYPQPVPVL